jgi:hypothetical protein
LPYLPGVATLPTRDGLAVPWDDEPLAAPRSRMSAPLRRPVVVDRASQSRWVVGARLVLAIVALLALLLPLAAARAEPASGAALIEAFDRREVTEVVHVEGRDERWLWDDGDALKQTSAVSLAEALSPPGRPAPSLDGDAIDQALQDRVPEVPDADRGLVIRSTTTWEVGSTGHLTWAFVLMPIAVAALLLGGPDPWLGNRWAWFWVTWVMHDAYAVAILAFALLSGPLPGVRRPLWRRRLSGWEGFALLPGLALLLWSGGLALSALQRFVV